MKLNNVTDLAKKDAAIENLKRKLQSKKQTNQRTFLVPSSKLTSSVACKSNNKASSFRVGQKLDDSKDAIIKKLTGIPEFGNADIQIEGKEIGHGRFGSVRRAFLTKLNLNVAAKVLDLKTSCKKSVIAEAIVSMTLSGHRSFPFCFGLLNQNTIIMEHISVLKEGHLESCPSLAQKLKTGIGEHELKHILSSALEGFDFMHSKFILHNDIKSDNIIVGGNAKIIDFGKATMTTNPRIYNIVPGSRDHHLYNSRHRHLAFELRNVPGSKQCIQTDLYSIGYLLKHSAAIVKSGGLVALGRMLKDQNPMRRISICNALDKIKLL